MNFLLGRLRMINSNNLPLIITLSIFSIVIMSYICFEKSSNGTKEISIIATLSSFAAVGRVPFAIIPGVQPTTFIVALTGYVFGPYEGFLTGSTAAFVSNIFLGQGPWTPWQMFSWGLVGCISGYIGKTNKKLSVYSFSFICFLYGFMFDWIMNLWHVLGFIRPINFQTVFLAYLSGFSMDIMHACGNFVFSIIFYENFLKVLRRFQRRLTISYIDNNNK